MIELGSRNSVRTTTCRHSGRNEDKSKVMNDNTVSAFIFRYAVTDDERRQSGRVARFGTDNDDLAAPLSLE